MSSPTSHLLNSAPVKQPSRVDGVALAQLRGTKSSSEGSERFAQLMKTYSGSQTMPPTPEVSMQAKRPESLAKPTVPQAIRPKPEGKSELHRQEEKLAQKKVSLNDEAKARAATSATAPNGSPNAAGKAEASKGKAAKPASGSEDASAEGTGQAGTAKSKAGDLSENSASVDATATAAANQKAYVGAALQGSAQNAAEQGQKGQSDADAAASNTCLAPQTSAMAATAATEFADDAQSGKSDAAHNAGPTPIAANSTRPALHAQQSPPTTALQTKQNSSTSTEDTTQSIGHVFGRELLAAQSNLPQSQAVTKSEGFALEGLMSAAGAATAAPLASRSEAPTGRQVTISQHLNEAGFAPEMAARLSVLAADGVQEAKLHLNPAEMGPVSVQIIVDGQQAQVSFHAEHEQTRAVLEQSLPDLAAALREAGLTLSGGGVFQQPGEQSRRQQQGPETAAHNGAARGETLNLGVTGQAVQLRDRPSRGVVDLYA